MYLNLVRCGLLAALIAVCSLIRIPLFFSPVPVTLQYFAVCVAALSVKKHFAAVPALLYVLLGAIGLPVFSGMTAGIGVIAGPTGGFILGFVAASWAMGAIYDGRKERLYGALAVGMVLMYACGMAGMVIALRIGLVQAFLQGVVPFFLLDLCKAALAGIVIRRLVPAFSLGK